MSSVCRKGSGWVVRWREGGRNRTSPRFGTEAEAADFRDDLDERQVVASKPDPRIRMEWAELVKRFVADRVARGHYAGRYANRVRAQLLAIGTVNKWRTAADVPATAKAGLQVGHRRSLVALLRFAIQIDQPVDRRFFDARNPPRKAPLRADLITDDQAAQAQTLAASKGPHAAALVHLLATYGHRPESLCQATVGAVNLAAGKIDLEVKGHRRVRHPLLPETVAVLRPIVEGRPASAPLFLDPHGEPWGTGQRFARWYQHQIGATAHKDAAGVYQLKRWAISGMLARGLDAVTVASITGHKTPSLLTDLYGRVNDQRQTAAMAKLVPPRSQPLGDESAQAVG